MAPSPVVPPPTKAASIPGSVAQGPAGPSKSQTNLLFSGLMLVTTLVLAGLARIVTGCVSSAAANQEGYLNRSLCPLRARSGCPTACRVNWSAVYAATEANGLLDGCAFLGDEIGAVYADDRHAAGELAELARDWIQQVPQNAETTVRLVSHTTQVCAQLAQPSHELCSLFLSARHTHRVNNV